MSVKGNTDKKGKQEERKKKKLDRKHTKLNAPHVMYNVKNTIPIINNSRQIDLGVVSRFSTQKFFKTWEGKQNASNELNLFFSQ